MRALVAATLALAGCSDGTSPVHALWDTGPGRADAGVEPDVAPPVRDAAVDAAMDAVDPDPEDAGSDGGRADGGEGDAARDAGPAVAEPLCGELEGDLLATSAAWTLGCDSLVPAGATLALLAGATLELGAYALAVRGTLDLGGGATIVITGAGTVTVHEGGRARFGPGTVRVRAAEDGATVVRVADGTLETEGTTWTDETTSITAVAAGQGAEVTLATSRFEGFWIALSVSAHATGSVVGTTFSDCGTGLRTHDRATLEVRESRFGGRGFHLVLDPDFFASDAPGVLADNELDPEGVPLLLAGTVDAPARIAPLDGFDGIDLLDVEVAPDVALELAAGLTLRLLGGGIRIHGTLTSTDVTFADLTETAIRFEPGSSGRIAGGSLSAGPVAGMTLLEVAGGSPELDGVAFSDPGGNAECLGISGAESAPVVRAASFEGCWVGVRADGGPVPTVVDSRFEGHGTGILLDGASEAEVQGNTFDSEGIHLYLSPRYFAAGARAGPSLSDNDFGEAGEPVRVAGVVDAGEARLRSLFGEGPLPLGTIQVAPGALLTAEPGLVLGQDGTSLIVEGNVQLEDVQFAALSGPAIQFREDSIGRLAGCRFEYAGGAPFPGIRVTDSSPEVEGNTFAGGGSSGTGVLVDGTAASPVPARPRVIDNTFSELRVGVVVSGDAEPVLEGNVFEGVETEVLAP